MMRSPNRLGAPRRAGFSLIEILVAISIIVTMVTLLLPAVQACREAARRATCVNQIRQIMIALSQYNLVHETLPPGSVNPTGPIVNVPKGYHYGWIVQVMPFLEQEPLFNRFNFALDLYHPDQGTLRLTRLNVLVCPSDPNRAPMLQPASSSYAGCHHHTEAPIDVTNDGMLILNKAIKPEQLADGLSQTVLTGEKQYEVGDLGWASGTRATLRNMGWGVNGTYFRRTGIANLPNRPIFAPNDPAFVGGYSSRHPGGANFGMADGSVKFLKDTISSYVLESLGNRLDEQAIDHNAY